MNYFFNRVNFLFPSDTFAGRLIKNFSILFSGSIIATAITFGFNILVVRYIGPTEFGRWNIVGSLSELFIIIPLFGMQVAVVRYLGSKENEPKSIIGTSFLTVSCLTIFLFLFYIFFKPILFRLLNISDNQIFYLAIIYSLVLIFFYLFQSFFQGVGQFKKLSVFWIISALIFVGSVLVSVFLLNDHSFLSLWYGNLLRLFFFVVIGIIVFGKFLFKFNKTVFKELSLFGFYQMISVFAGFFSLGMIDNLMINYYLGPTAVGIYAAYYAVFSIFLAKILTPFSQVFLPMASGHPDIKGIFSTIIKIYKKWAAWLVIAVFFAILVLFKFYGKDFIFDWKLAMLMTIYVLLYISIIILGNLIVSVGIRGAKFPMIFSITSSIINVVLNIILIPRWQLAGSIIASIIATSAILLASIYVLKRLIMNFSYNKTLSN